VVSLNELFKSAVKFAVLYLYSPALSDRRAVAVCTANEYNVFLADSVTHKTSESISENEHSADVTEVKLLVAVGHTACDNRSFWENRTGYFKILVILISHFYYPLYNELLGKFFHSCLDDIFAENVANLPDIRSICVTCECDSEHICDVNNASLELLRILLEVLGLYSKTEFFGYDLYLSKPLGRIISVAVGFKVLIKEGLYGSFNTIETGWGFWKIQNDGENLYKTVGQASAEDAPTEAPTDKNISHCYPYRAYLKLPTQSGAKTRGYVPCFIGAEEMIGEGNNDGRTGQGQGYNLMGQRVNADTKGMVIVNGKKYLNK